MQKQIQPIQKEKARAAATPSCHLVAGRPGEALVSFVPKFLRNCFRIFAAEASQAYARTLACTQDK